MSKLTQLPSWRALDAHYRDMAGRHMRDLFAADPDRFRRFSLSACGILLDYSKNRIDAETIRRLMDLARASDVEGWRGRLFAGEHVNNTEDRPALHMALRANPGDRFEADGRDVVAGVLDQRARMRAFVEAVRSGRRRGFSGERITDVVNIGIGGSDLGPHLVARAVSPHNSGPVRTHFIPDIDGWKLKRVLGGLSWESTLFVLSSKSFTTQETLLNAACVRRWIESESGSADAWARHVAAATARPEKAKAFGVPDDAVFEYWDWVGGRYSLWSAAGLVAALGIGMDRFEELLAGARDMDRHFLSQPLEQNLPVIMALLGVWYVNFFRADSQAVIPYDDRLARLPHHLRQMDMESNGKGVDRDGNVLDYDTAPVMWGGTGISSQHSFFQKFHQGGGVVPMDFYVVAEASDRECGHYDAQLASFLAQSSAFMRGNSDAEIMAELKAAGMDDAAARRLTPHKRVFGNNPSNTLVLDHLDARTLGALIAIYEHKIFVQSVIWNVNPYDQWGVELGKKLARAIVADLGLDLNGDAAKYDPSTIGLMRYLKERRGDGES